MSQEETKKHLKTWDEAILELGSFIQKSKAEEAQKANNEAEEADSDKAAQ